MKKISRFATVLVLIASFGVPFFALAIPSVCPDGSVVNDVSQCQSKSGGGININAIKPYSDSIINIINGILVPVLMAIAFIVFLWGVFKYFIWGAESDTERATGRQFVLWGIIGFVVILCVWGLVAIVTGTLSLTPGGKAPNTPTL